MDYLNPNFSTLNFFKQIKWPLWHHKSLINNHDPTEKANGISVIFTDTLNFSEISLKFQWKDKITEISVTKIRSMKFQWNSSDQD